MSSAKRVPEAIDGVEERVSDASRTIVIRRTAPLPGGRALDLERRLSYRFSIFAARMIRSVAGMYVPKYGLLPSGWKAMAAIGRYGPVSAKEVCARTTVAPDKVTRAVDRLVELGFVNRKQDSADRRRVVLSLSPAGRRTYEDIERATRRVEIALLAGLTKRERAALERILTKLEARAERHLGVHHAGRTTGEPRQARALIMRPEPYKRNPSVRPRK